MLITKEVQTTWNPTTRKYYENLGYVFTKYNAGFVVKIQHLHTGSNKQIDFICDICNIPSSTRYNGYNRIKNKYGKDICNKCMCGTISQNTRKQKDENYANHDTHEKRKIELNDYLNKYKTLDKMTANTTGKRLYDNFKSHNDDVYETAIDLGYKIENITNSMPKKYYTKHPEILKERLLNFTNEYKRFPRHQEMEQVLHISSHFIKQYGGLDEFKKLINYDDSKDLIDLRGDYNRSLGELIVANYLCSQGLKDKYSREQYPFPKEEGRFRSDFSFHSDNNIDIDKDIHVEVWGFKASETKINEKAPQYYETKKVKEDLYTKYSNELILININYEIFNKKYDEIQKYLYELFSPYVGLEFKNVSYKKLLSSSVLNDEELFKEVMKISPDGVTFPLTSNLLAYSSGSYAQILKRGYTYKQFANKYGVKTSKRLA